jgi:phosphate starvation-inducible PhoH-like protein
MSRKRIKKVSNDLYKPVQPATRNNKIFIRPKLEPKNDSQANYIRLMAEKEIVFCGGPAGTGKTYCSVAYGLQKVLAGYYEKLILIRPAVTSEEIGLLPGDIADKINPFMESVMAILLKFLSKEELLMMEKEGKIVIKSLAYLRGITLDKSFVVVDEAENCNKKQLMLIVTRIGEDSKLVIQGDETQSDLKKFETMAFARHLDIFESYCDEIGVFRFSEADIVRNKIIGKYLKAIRENYETHQVYNK